MSRGRPVSAVFDVPLVRAYQDSDARAPTFFTSWVEASRRIGIGIVSALDPVARSRDERDRADWVFFLDNITVVIPLTDAAVARADRLHRSTQPPCGISADDALVAATAIVRKLPLYTLDPDRYAGIPGLTVLPVH